MNDYKTYMDRVALTEDQHAQLMTALSVPSFVANKNNYVKLYAALAASLALVCTAAWGLWQGGAMPRPPVSGPAAVLPGPTAQPNAQVYSDPADPQNSFRADGRPGPTGHPPAVHIPYVETPAPTDGRQYVTVQPPAAADQTDKDLAPRQAGQGRTLDQCRADLLYGAHLPRNLPGRFTFESGVSYGEDLLSALWTNGMEEVRLFLARPETAPQPMDVSDPAGYDVGLYPIPWADSVPENVREGGFEDPVFRYEDLTKEVIAARALCVPGDSGDVQGARFQFSVLYPDGVVARYLMKGVTVQEVAEMLPDAAES